MGLLSKLFGNDKEMEKAAKDILGGIFGEAAKQQQEAEAKRSTNVWDEAPKQQDYQGYAAPAYDDEEDGPSGESWGPRMPQEENQYNYNGAWYNYFENIFRSDFPEYSFVREEKYGMKRLVYTFTGARGTALVVELMSRTSSSKKLRENCQNQGIPYLRFYYDYDGWWNTRNYVVKRMRNAING